MGRKKDESPHPRRTYISDGGTRFEPANETQADYYEAILHDNLLAATGPAGTGKTFVAVAGGLHMLSKGMIRQIVCIRPAQGAGENLGYFPGDQMEKLAQWMEPFHDAFTSLMGKGNFIKAVEHEGAIKFASIQTMRGRNLDNALILLDEAQNTTPTQMEMLTTRVGYDSTMVIMGDQYQTDIGRRNGLADFLSLVEEEDLAVPVIEFDESMVQRSGVCAMMVKAYSSRRKRNA